ncbi:hypothetical protein MAP00_009017 [Monascus purpureus]|nr:hypothetical protein MAP00_009017 [Monascus purpureus]
MWAAAQLLSRPLSPFGLVVIPWKGEFLRPCHTFTPLMWISLAVDDRSSLATIDPVPDNKISSIHQLVRVCSFALVFYKAA